MGNDECGMEIAELGNREWGMVASCTRNRFMPNYQLKHAKLIILRLFVVKVTVFLFT